MHTFNSISKQELDKLKDNIYETKFHKEDENDDGDVTVFSGGAEEVLKALQDMDDNPLLLDYVFKCLSNQGIFTKPEKLFYVIANKEERMPYNEKIHGTFENYIKHCIDGDFGLRKSSHIVKKVFRGIDEIEMFMMKYQGDDITGIGNTKFDKYSIKELSANAN